MLNQQLPSHLRVGEQPPTATRKGWHFCSPIARRLLCNLECSASKLASSHRPLAGRLAKIVDDQLPTARQPLADHLPTETFVSMSQGFGRKAVTSRRWL